MPLDRYPEITKSAEISPLRPDTQDEKTLDQLGDISKRAFLVGALLTGAAAFVGCNTAEKSPETQSNIFKFQRLSPLMTPDFADYAGVEAKYTLAEPLRDAQLEAEDENGRLLHSQNISLEAGEGKIVFFEPDYQNSPGYTHTFRGASETRLVRIKGKDQQGSNVEESVEVPVGLLD